MWVAGVGPYLASAAQPEQRVGRRVSVAVVIFALIGAISLTIEQQNATRVLTSCSVLLTITRNESFARMLQTFCLAVSACAALVASLLVVMLLFAVASRDLFGAGPTDDDGTPYFDTYARSLSTMFRVSDNVIANTKQYKCTHKTIFHLDIHASIRAHLQT